jgi:hypothetical protein
MLLLSKTPPYMVRKAAWTADTIDGPSFLLTNNGGEIVGTSNCGVTHPREIISSTSANQNPVIF